jgi:8-oxo-dGTP pyrophosphatase MutT (NUDIX family)
MHKRLHRWLQPGGHLLEGEGPSEAARRESEEETGLELAHPVPGPRLIHVDVHDAANGHTHFDLRYLLLAPDRDPAPPPGESPEARWFGWEEAGAVADDALVGALQAARLQPEVEGPGHAGAVVARSDAVGKDGAPRHNGGETGRRGVDGTT